MVHQANERDLYIFNNNKVRVYTPYPAISVPSFDDKIMEAKYEETILLHRTGKYCINVSTGASHTTNLKIVVSIYKICS